MIRFYLEGHIDKKLVDFELLIDGSLSPNYFTKNNSLTSNILVHMEGVGLTPEQLAVIRHFANKHDVSFSFLHNN